MLKLKRSACAVLPLVLKGKWYDMIERGEKTEEYRAAKHYWDVRIGRWFNAIISRMDREGVVVFRRGYSRNAPQMVFRAKGLLWPTWDRTEYHPEWGEPLLPHYTIVLFDRVELED